MVMLLTIYSITAGPSSCKTVTSHIELCDALECVSICSSVWTLSDICVCIEAKEKSDFNTVATTLINKLYEFLNSHSRRKSWRLSGCPSFG